MTGKEKYEIFIKKYKKDRFNNFIKNILKLKFREAYGYIRVQHYYSKPIDWKKELTVTLTIILPIINTLFDIINFIRDFNT